MTPTQIEGLLVALGALVVPGLLFWVWMLWLELRQTRELADYYCEQWESLARRQKEEDALTDWLADW